MTTNNFLQSKFGFAQPMTVARHIEWLEHCGLEHISSKYNLPAEPSEEQLGLAMWKEHKAYNDYLSMPLLCYEGDTPSSGVSNYNLN
jgi:hypothetical protein